LAPNRFAHLRTYEWLLPTAAAALAATRFAPVATPALLVLLACLPGLYVMRACGLAGRWDAAGRAVFSVAASLAITPVLLNPLWHLTNQPGPLLGSVWLALSAAYRLTRWLERRARGTRAIRPADMRSADEAAPTVTRPGRFCERRSSRVILAIVAAIVAFSTLGTYWPTEALGYPVPALIHDFVKHHAVLFSLQQRPLPLGSPFYAEGAGGPAYYYHFFYLIPAMLRAVCPTVSIELAFSLQAALVALATAGMCYLIVKRFTGGEGPAVLAAIMATLVGGLDLIPLLVTRTAVITLDAWADPVFRIHSLLTQMVWTPQNVQGVLIGLLGVYVLSERGAWRGWLLLGPLLGAALLGSSVWVSMAFLPGLALHVLLGMAARRATPRAAMRHLLAAATVTGLVLVMAAPSLSGYAEMSQRHGKSLTWEWPYAWHAFLGKLAPPGIVANLLDLPWFLTLEFGPLLIFPLLLPRATWRRAWSDDGLRLLLLSAAVALAAFVSVRSHFTYNDFGQKIIMVALAAGVVLAACLLAPGAPPSIVNPLGWSLPAEWSSRRRRVCGALLCVVLLLSLPVGLFQSPLAAVRRYLPEVGPLRVLSHPAAQRAGREASAGRFLRERVPPDAVLQADCGVERLNLVQIARRQMGVAVLERDTEVFLPADRESYERCLAEVSAALTEPGDAAAAHAVLRRHHITHVFVGEIERERWRDAAKFDAPGCFECVFRDGELAVYELK